MDRLTEADTNYTFLSIGNQAVKYGYDKASNRNSMTDPQSIATTFGYDVLNRLSSLTYNGQTPNYTFGYDPLSRRNSLTRPNGINTTYGYDSMSDLLSVLHKLGTTTLDGATYTYDQAGNRKTRTDKRTNVTLTYGYDNIYQLLSAKQGTTTKESYTYDLVGNRLSSLGVSPYNYNSSNELTSTPSGSYTYDNNGNEKSRPDGTTFSWDSQNRMTQVVLPGTGGTVNFKYDAFGHRVQKSFTQGTTTTTTNYLYDGNNLLEVLDNGGNVLVRYTGSLSVDELLSEIASGTTNHYQQDGLGSILSMSSAAGSLSNTYTYDAYGRLTASSGTIANLFRYNGREFDTETSIYSYRARYYDPVVGRFVSEDPARFPGGVNFYTYVENDPTQLVDPFGFCPWEIHTRPLKGLPALPHYYFYNTQTGRSIGLGPAPGYTGRVASGVPVPGSWETNENPGHKVLPVPDWACNCVDNKSRNPGNPPNYCTYKGNATHDPHPVCTNCIGWTGAVLQDCHNQASAGQQ